MFFLVGVVIRVGVVVVIVVVVATGTASVVVGHASVCLSALAVLGRGVGRCLVLDSHDVVGRSIFWVYAGKVGVKPERGISPKLE